MIAFLLGLTGGTGAWVAVWLHSRLEKVEHLLQHIAGPDHINCAQADEWKPDREKP